MGDDHRRRIKTEEKAKVVTSSLGDSIDSIQEQDELHQDDMKNRMISSLSSNNFTGAK